MHLMHLPNERSPTSPRPQQSLQELDTNVLYTLGQLSREFPEIREDLHGALKTRGLAVPSRPPSRMSAASRQSGDSYSRPGSRMSSRGMSREGGRPDSRTQGGD